HIQVQHDGVEDRRELEEILEVVRRIGDAGRRKPSELRRSHLWRGELAVDDEGNPPCIHVEPDDQREQYRPYERQEYVRLAHPLPFRARMARRPCRFYS